MLTIATFLWTPIKQRSDRVVYTPDHVERLARGLRRHLTIPYRFVVLTDREAAEFREPDAVLPLWRDHLDLGGCYVRLRAFSPEMREVLGPRFAWIDLDTVVAGNCDAIFSRTEPFIAWKDVSPTTPYCASLLMMDTGARAEVWHDFDPVKSPILSRPFIGGDQAWIGRRLGPDEAVWTEADGIYSYKKHCLNGLPADARLVFFHGSPDPSRPECRHRSPWIERLWT